VFVVLSPISVPNCKSSETCWFGFQTAISIETFWKILEIRAEVLELSQPDFQVSSTGLRTDSCLFQISY